MIELPAAFDLETELETTFEPDGTSDGLPETSAGPGGDDTRRLPEGYYAANFLRLLEVVDQRDADLLAPAEKQYVDRLRGLTEPARRLYVRLVMRKGPLFRRDRLVYEEIADLDAALDELAEAGLVDDGEDATLEELLSLLRRNELIELAHDLSSSFASALPCDLSSASTARRGELIAALLEIEHAEIDAYETGPVEVILRQRLEVARPLGLETLWLLRLLFFGNLEQDWREFMLADLGVHRYETYELSRETRLFTDRRALLDTLELGLRRVELRSLLSRPYVDERLEAAVAIARDVAEKQTQWHTAAWRHAERILAKVGRALERVERFEESLELYEIASQPPSRERRCRVLARLGRKEKALRLVEGIARQPLDEVEASFAPPFAHRLKRQLGLTREKWRRPQRPVETIEVEAAVLEMPRPAVEWLALALLEERGRHGVYSENWLWRSLFGLAFWDIIFAPLPGVFVHPFQLGPLDMGSPEFYRQRQELIDRRLDELRDECDLEARLMPVYEEKYGVSNAFVAWHPQLEESLRFAMTHTGGEAFATICQRLARDPGRHRRGLPDLLMQSTDSPVGVELLEVKAPGDQLRPEQGAWIDYLNTSGVPARILRLVAI